MVVTQQILPHRSLHTRSFGQCRPIDMPRGVPARPIKRLLHLRKRHLSIESGMATISRENDVMVDNPCWGTPEKCSLGDLLRNLERTKAILLETPDYLALDKPADLRMDGNFPATVHKLLTYWYPPPSLQPIRAQSNKESWLKEVAKYHRHSDHPDNELRPCHQLDYATSGVLLIARSRKAASVTRKLFEERKTNKAYLALLHGHVHVSGDWPQLTESVMNERLLAQEEAFRRSRQKRRPETFDGYQPPHAIYQQWQHHAQQKSRKKKSKLTDDQWQVVWKTLDATRDSQQQLNPNRPWSHVKQSKQTEPFEEAAKVYNQFVIAEHEKKEKERENDTALPVVFRLESDGPDCFYMAAPIGEIDDEFKMFLPPSLDPQPPLKAGPPDLIYRPALTQCIVLERGSLGGKKVTKVRLVPRTGRRHQLRVHCSYLGNAILGDRTYEATDGRDLLNRMCLHSQMLEISLDAGGGEPTRIEAADPFPTTIVSSSSD